MTSEAKTAEAQQAKATQEAEAKAPMTIPGMVAVDVYGSMESKGFECTSRTGQAGGSLWDCKDEPGPYSHTVSITGRGPTAIEYVSATSLDYSGTDPDGVARDFLAHVASVPFDGANPGAASAWVKQNVGRDGATATYGGAVFTLRATGGARILEIKAAGLP